MQALTIEPGVANSLRIDVRPEPELSGNDVLVQTIAIGVCGTDREIASGRYGAAAPGRVRLVIGHESLGRVVMAPPESGFASGDHVVGIVRRPDPVPCPACAAGEWDMCFNGLFTERGIRRRDGFASERFRIDPAYLVHVDHALGLAAVLTEPASIVAKAWQHADLVRRIAPRQPHRVLITGAGTVGLLAALMGAQRGHEIHILDRLEDGPKPKLAAELGATYYTCPIKDLPTVEFDTVMECTGARPVIAAVQTRVGRNCVICLAGVSTPGHDDAFDIGLANRVAVLRNATIFGTVNANRRHYAEAVRMLSAADPDWLAQLITRQVPLARFEDAFENQPHDIKVVMTFEAGR